MSESSISVAVRVRPFSSKEAALLAPVDTWQPFLGDGGLGGSPTKALNAPGYAGTPSGANAPGSAAGGAPGPGPSSLRTKYLRSIVQPVDDKVLIFDPPDNNPLSRLMTSVGTNTYAHGARKPRDIRYAFDRVFPDYATQQEVFENTTKPLLDGILSGYNASVFAYGATGCGKTHTISGTAEDPGVIFLTMRELYTRVAELAEESEFNIRLSYLEIYNEMIRDLLSPEPTPHGQGLALREDSANKISVVGITELIPDSPEQVLEMITEGNKRRTMSPTEANAVSSRSHAVLQINVTQRPRTANTIEQTTSASLNIIDLAGSERASATRNNGQRMKEGANINKSLLALGNCINALCQSGGQKGRHVPYRNSKLTRLLKFSLGGNCKTVMIVCVSPSSAHFEETHNTLKYANQAKNIRTKVTRNMMNVDRHVAQYVQAIHELNEEVAELKKKLAERGSLESAAEKRKKEEIAKEVEDAKTRMRDSTEQVKRLVQEKAASESRIQAAELRKASFTLRMAEIEEDLRGVEASSLASDLESEKLVLAKLIAKEDAILSDAKLLSAARTLTNSIQMQQGIIIAASHNTRFDEDASEMIRNLGLTYQAEVENLRSKVKLMAMQDAIQQGVHNLITMVTLATRCTVALKESAGELEYRAGQVKSDDVESHSTGLLETLSEMSQRFREVSVANDTTFQNVAGVTTLDVHLPAKAKSSAVKRARVSLSPAAAPAAPVVTVEPPKRTTTKSGTLAPSASSRALARSVVLSPIRASPVKAARVSAGYAAPTAASRAHLAGSPRRPVPSPRRITRRQSMLAAAARRSSTAPVSASAGARTTGKASLPPQSGTTKKAFRWADEAGEGSIDDAGPSRKKAASTDAPVLEEVQEQSAENANEQINGESGTESSANEWEDVPLEVDKRGSATQGAKRVPATGGLFNKDFLAKKGAVAPTRTVSSGSATNSSTAQEKQVGRKVSASKATASEAVVNQPRRSSARIRASLGGAAVEPPARVAFSDVRNVSGSRVATTDDNPFDEDSAHSKANELEVHGAETRGTPYKRRESAGVGPVRRARGRLSGSVTSSPASAKLAGKEEPLPSLPPIFAAIAKERDAMGTSSKTTTMVRPPPNNTAARAAAAVASSSASSSSELDSSSGSPKRPLGKRTSAVRVAASGTKPISVAASLQPQPRVSAT